MESMKKITKEMREMLRADFPAEAYSSHPTKTFLTTLKSAYVLERLNDVFGVGRWYLDTEIVERTKDYVLVLSKFNSLDYEVYVTPQYGGHKTEGKNTEIADGYKSAVTDSLSKIASYLEVGLEMFKGKISVKKTYQNTSNSLPFLNKDTKQWNNVLNAINKGSIKSIDDIKKHYKISKSNLEHLNKLIV